MPKLTEYKTIRLTPQQAESLRKLACYDVNVGNFIRDAISEKIRREWPSIKEKHKRVCCPF